MSTQKSGVGIVVVSHNRALAEELIRFASVMKSSEFPLVNGSGTEPDSSELGTNALLVQEAVERADSGKGVVIVADIGSAIISAQMAIENLPANLTARLADCPLVEGLVAAVAANHEKASLEEVVHAAEAARNYHKA